MDQIKITTTIEKKKNLDLKDQIASRENFDKGAKKKLRN